MSILFLYVLKEFCCRQYITDGDDFSDIEELTKIEDFIKKPLQASACVPDYILLSGGNCSL